MRLERIYIENFQGLQHADLELNTPITMVLGANGAGKSSLKEAIGLALGESARVAHKKDYAQLVTEGQKKAQIIISHDGVASSFTLPSGKSERNDTPGGEYLPFVLNPGAFAALDDKARRKMLFALTKSSARPDVVAGLLAAKGANAKKVEAIKPLLLSGFAAAQDQAKSNTSESRGAWKVVTGEAYGVDKAETWCVTVPALAEDVAEVTAEDMKAAQEEKAAAAVEIEKGNQYLGGLNASRTALSSLHTRKAALEEVYLQLNRRRNKLEATTKELDGWKVKVTEAEQNVAAYTGESHCDCPNCGVKLKVIGKSVEVFKGKTADQAKLADAQAELRKASDSVGLFTRTLANDKKSMDEAEQAGRDLKALVENYPEPVTDEQITRAEKAIQVQRNIRDAASAKAEAIGERLDLIANAGKKTQEAMQHHQDVKDWILIEKALAPDGIPGEILAGALKPFNAALARVSALAGWTKVQIDGAMNITAADRLYALLSESEKWRVETLLAIVIALQSGLRMVVLDRFDVLDMPSRTQCIGMLLTLAKSGEIESAVVCGTLKEKPAKLPPEIQAIWIANGIAGEPELQKSA
ncbi:AAA family ATPase [Pseudomonas caspiana]